MKYIKLDLLDIVVLLVILSIVISIIGNTCYKKGEEQGIELFREYRTLQEESKK